MDSVEAAETRRDSPSSSPAWGSPFPDPGRFWAILPFLLAALALAARLIPGPRIVDDAYITFRYARNILAGNGFVYNPGERVLGTTTPLYTLLLVAASLLTGSRNMVSLAVAVNGLAGAASVLALYHLGSRFAGSRAVGAAAGLLWSLAPFSVTFAIGGMETDLTIALLLGTFLAHLNDRPGWMGAGAALAFLARPDTLIATAPLFLARWAGRRRLPVREAGTALACLTPWLLWAALYFGSPLPASLSAKSAAYRIGPTDGLIRLLQHYATPFSEHYLLPPVGVLLLFGLYVGLSVLGGRRAFCREPQTWPISLYPLLYAAVFALANPLIFRWYLSPPLPLYFLLILSGAWAVAGDVARGRFRHAALALFTAAALLLTLNGWVVHPDHGPDRPAPEMAWFELELLYQQAADVVLETAEEGDTLCAGDIGVLGYRTDLHVLDTVGLVTPETQRYYPADPDIYVINYAIPADLVLALDPDYIVILEVYGRRGLLPDPRFQERYTLLQRLDTDIYGSEGMLIWRKR